MPKASNYFIIFKKFYRFLLVGGGVGLLGWAIQRGLVVFLAALGLSAPLSEGLAVMLSFACIGFIAFFLHKVYTFETNGNLFHFYVANLSIIILISMTTVFFSYLFIYFGFDDLAFLSYPLSAIICAPVSFFLKLRLVYQRRNA